MPTGLWVEQIIQCLCWRHDRQVARGIEDLAATTTMLMVVVVVRVVGDQPAATAAGTL